MKIPVRSVSPVSSVLCVVMLATIPSATHAQCTPIEKEKLLASDGAVDDYFGYSVGVSGIHAVIGAHRDDDNGEGSGSAYAFRFDGSQWTEKTKLTSSTGSEWDEFGIAVAISGNTIVVGAPFDNTGAVQAGAAYIFRFNGAQWVEEAKLLASVPHPLAYFGSSVAISGDTAVIGSYNNDQTASSAGAAYVFRFDGTHWIHETRLSASDGEMNDYFGWSVAISGDTAVIGAKFDQDNGWESGSVYVYRFNGSQWIEEAKLVASDGAANDEFGVAVAISGNIAVIGAWLDGDLGNWSGSAYVFEFGGSTWTQEAKLIPSDGGYGDWFGASVAISGDVVLVGAFFDDFNALFDSGSAYLFRYDGMVWAEEAKLLASDGALNDHFARSVAISGTTAFLGASDDDDNGLGSGSVYVFDINCPGVFPELIFMDGFDSGDTFQWSLTVN